MVLRSSRVVLSLLTLTLSGCFTGTMIESGRLSESVLTYERISVEGDDLQLEYTVEITRGAGDPDDRGTREATRRAAFPLSELEAIPAHPVDEFPLRRFRKRADRGDVVPIVVTTRPNTASENERRMRPAGVSGSWIAEVTDSDGRHLGFQLCATQPASGAHPVGTESSAVEGPCLDYFYSAALFDDPVAWWVYPVAPFAFALDLAVLPIQILTLPPLIFFSD
jgi:hypothetical protein